MKRLTVLLVLAAAILPSVVQAKGDEAIKTILGGLALFAAIKDAQTPATKPAAGSLFGGGNAPTGPVVVVTRFEGDYGDIAQEEAVRVLTGLGYQSRAAVGTKELGDTMDELRLENSEWGQRGDGRNPIGEFSGAEFLIVGKCQIIGQGSNDAWTAFAQGRLEELTVELTVKAFDVRTAKMAGQVMKASGTARRLSDIEFRKLRDQNHWWGNVVEAEVDRRLYVDLSRRAIASAADRALRNELPVANQQVPAPVPVVESAQPLQSQAPEQQLAVGGEMTFAFPTGRAFTVTLNDGKVIHEGDLIKFFRSGKSDALAQYKVVGIDGQTVILELDYGTQPETADGFRIICTH